MRTQYDTATSLDGFIATTDHSLQWLFQLGDVRPVHAQMCAAANGRNLWLVGGGELVGQFFDAGLLDELIVQVGLVTLGAGQPLLPRQIAFPPLRLLSVRQVGSGFAALHYEVPRPV